MRSCRGLLKARSGSRVEHCIEIKLSQDDLEKFRYDQSGKFKIVAEVDLAKYEPVKYFYNYIEANGMTLTIEGIDRDVDNESKLVFTAQLS